MNPVLGHIKCPHCENENATIHQEKKGKTKALYYRCENCGTVQCRYKGGQDFIKKHGRFIESNDAQAKDEIAKQAAAVALAEAAELRHKVAKEKAKEVPPPEPASPKKKTLLDIINEAL